MAIVTCPWCETQIPNPSFTNCPNCGGTLSFSDGNNPGPPPPLAPRELPAKFIKKVKYSNNVWTILGIVFTATVVLSILGIIFWRKGLRMANAELNPLMNGTSTHGTITSVDENSAVKINGRSPFVIDFVFNANGRQMTGSVGNLFDQSSRSKKTGDKVWVVYMPDDPEQSSIWPPLA
jgi:hypothetical protein